MGFLKIISGFYLLPIRSQVPHDVHGLDRSVNHVIVLYKFFCGFPGDDF